MGETKTKTPTDEGKQNDKILQAFLDELAHPEREDGIFHELIAEQLEQEALPDKRMGDLCTREDNPEPFEFFHRVSGIAASGTHAGRNLVTGEDALITTDTFVITVLGPLGDIYATADTKMDDVSQAFRTSGYSKAAAAFGIMPEPQDLIGLMEIGPQALHDARESFLNGVIANEDQTFGIPFPERERHHPEQHGVLTLIGFRFTTVDEEKDPFSLDSPLSQAEINFTYEALIRELETVFGGECLISVSSVWVDAIGDHLTALLDLHLLAYPPEMQDEIEVEAVPDGLRVAFELRHDGMVLSAISVPLEVAGRAAPILRIWLENRASLDETETSPRPAMH